MACEINASNFCLNLSRELIVNDNKPNHTTVVSAEENIRLPESISGEIIKYIKLFINTPRKSPTTIINTVIDAPRLNELVSNFFKIN